MPKSKELGHGSHYTLISYSFLPAAPFCASQGAQCRKIRGPPVWWPSWLSPGRHCLTTKRYLYQSKVRSPKIWLGISSPMQIVSTLGLAIPFSWSNCIVVGLNITILIHGCCFISHCEYKTRDDVEMKVLLLLVNANPRRGRFQGFIPVTLWVERFCISKGVFSLMVAWNVG